MTTVYKITGDCGDYYCDGDHLLAIAIDECRANALAEQARAKDRFLGTKYASVRVTGPFPIGELVAEEFSV